ncbi:hypothetical protein Patl1_18415 [Pistacia atlantica]|uniref:Uncharacterized protein n=1 Tax=Pistacia atlantica TaxID=434234 RepID=A0ACC1BZ96_9ROSI|nr:hypothetical protein Patl1_18415 [Pistacia atlantica]
MAYKMRTRKQTMIYLNHSGSSEDEGYDSTYSDPDYTRTRPQRRSRNNNVSSSSSSAPLQIADRNVQMEETAPETGSSSRSNNGGAVKRRRRRPPKNNSINNGEQGRRSRRPSIRLQARPPRRRRSSNLHQRPSTSNTSRDVLPRQRTILSWLIDKEIIQENEQVWYMDKSRHAALQEGKITRAGVLCRCCYKVITVHEFEDHAERSTLKRPYDNIYLVRLQSYLLSYLVKALQGEDEVSRRAFNLIQPQTIASDQNDDACMICADGGDLICCERCPSTFHPNCLDLEVRLIDQYCTPPGTWLPNIPQGDWLCPHCVCKFCGAGSSSSLTLTACVLCEMQYHGECVLEIKGIDLNRPSVFCSSICGEEMVGVRKELDNGYSWTLLRRMQALTYASGNELNKMVECNCKIAVAWTVMDEIFMPTIDRFTTINVVQSVIYNRGSNLMRLNFKRFFTAILEHNDEIISIATLRVNGNKLAEMPFVGTREKYRGKGMVQKLLTALESALCFLKVENLVIPSVPELVPMWKEKYSFSPINNGLIKDLISTNTLMFPTAVRLQKSLAPQATDSADAVENKPNGVNDNTKIPLPDLNLEPSEEDVN